MKTTSKFNDMPLQTISRKVWSSFIDGLLLLVLGAILTFSLGFSILRNNETFEMYNNQCFNNINEMYKIQEESKLQIIEDDTNRVLSPADYFDVYITKQINLSYLTFKEEFNNKGITLEIKENEYSTLENDELAYYFINYKVNKNINMELYENKSPLLYFKENIFFKNIKQEYYLDKENNLPVLNSNIAISLYNHYHNIEKNIDLHHEFSDAVLQIRNIGLNDLTKYDLFNSYYELYSEAYNEMKKYDNVMLLICFTLSFIIVVFIPSIVTKNGVTLGKLLTRTRTISSEGYKMKKYKFILNNILSFMVNAFIIVFISLFTFGFENLTLNLLTLGSINVSFLHLLLFSFVMMVANFLVIAITPEHCSLIDMILNTKQMDISTYIEPKTK